MIRQKRVLQNSKCIALNGRFSGTLKPTGTQTAAYELYNELVKLNREYHIIVFADPSYSEIASWNTYPNTTLVPIPFAKWSRNRAQLWEQLILPKLARRHGATIVHHPITTASVWKNGLKHIVTIHDLNFYHNPQWFAVPFRLWLKFTAVPAMRNADKIVTVSDYVFEDVHQTFAIPRSNLIRIYNGLRTLKPRVSQTRSHAQNILCVNPWPPHKNLKRLVAAISILKVNYPELQLFIVGRTQAQFIKQPEINQIVQQPWVKVLGYLTDEGLADAYASATVFCYPSLGEGFGLPVLEAMSAGVPVVTSNISCLPEIASGAAFLINPFSEIDIARGITEALSEEKAKREKRISLGKSIAAKFNSRNFAVKYSNLFSSLLNEN